MSRITAHSLENSAVLTESRAIAKGFCATAFDPYISPDEKIEVIESQFIKPEEFREKGYVYALKSLLLNPELSESPFERGCKLLSELGHRGKSALLTLGLSDAIPLKRQIIAIRNAENGTEGLRTAIGCNWEEIQKFLSSKNSPRNLIIELGSLLTRLGDQGYSCLLNSIPKSRLDDHTLWSELLRRSAYSPIYPPNSEGSDYPPKLSTPFSKACVECLEKGGQFPNDLPFQKITSSLSEKELTIVASIIGARRISSCAELLLDILSDKSSTHALACEAAISLAKLGDSRAIEPINEILKQGDLDEQSLFRLSASLWALGDNEPREYLTRLFSSKKRLVNAKVTSSLITSLIIKNRNPTSLNLALKYYRICPNGGEDISSLVSDLDHCIFASLGAIGESASELEKKKLTKSHNDFHLLISSLIDDRNVPDIVRSSALLRFKYIEYPGVLDKIIAEARSEENSLEFRVCCVRALRSYTNNAEATECLEQLLKSEHPPLRRAAISSLDKSLSEEGVELLEKEAASAGIKECKDAFLTMTLSNTDRILFDAILNPEQFFHASRCLEKKLYSKKHLREFIENIPERATGRSERYRRALLECPDLGIHAPFRYTPEFLVELVRNRTISSDRDPRRTLLFLAAESDHNGALTEFASLIEQVAARFRYKVVLYEVAGSKHYASVLDAAANMNPDRFDVAVISAHGAPDSLHLGSSSKSKEERNILGEDHLSINHILSLRKKGEKVLKDGGFVYLHACSTARSIKGTNMHDMHRKIFPNARDFGIAGSKAPLSADDIFFSFEPNYELGRVEGKTLLTV